MAQRNPVEHTVTFDKRRYHQHIEMCDWCKSNIGPGKWLGGTPSTWVGLDIDWCVDSVFGNTTFSFKEAKHFTWFLLRWS